MPAGGDGTASISTAVVGVQPSGGQASAKTHTTNGFRSRGATGTSTANSGSRSHAGSDNGARGTRTPDLLGAIQALSQLSYSPEERTV